MVYKNSEIRRAAELLKAKLIRLDDKRQILKAPELGALYERIKTLPAGEVRAAFGKEVNALRAELETTVQESQAPKAKDLSPVDVTAPFDVNIEPPNRPQLLTAASGSKHPLMSELEKVLDIFSRMGFLAIESRQLDDDYHMFGSLNFPEGHPVRDEYDTFLTEEGLIAPAHTSTMQNRVLKKYFQKDVKVKIQPFYFPFTEPSFEFAASCPFCDQAGCNVCSYTGWIELLGCGMIHPNVLREGGIDPQKYTGFAWGGGIERLVMIKYDIEDIRHFESANLKFLRQFS
jgi:phenylalanyl-tRNA synthetase alpha chain